MSSAAARAGRASASATAARRARRRLAGELNRLQVARPDLIRAGRRPPVEGGRAAQGERHGLALAQRHVGPHALAVVLGRLEGDAGDVVEGDAQAAPPEVALEARIGAAGDARDGHPGAVDVGEGGAEVARGEPLLAPAAESAHADEARARGHDGEQAPGEASRVSHVPSQRLGRGRTRRPSPLSGSARALQHGPALTLARNRPLLAHMPRVLGIVMAGGRGDRLQPLTRSRSKAAVPFGARHRIIDYVLSNFVNSGIYALYVLVQYKSQSLIEHVSGTWRIGGRLPETVVTVVPPQRCGGERWGSEEHKSKIQSPCNLVCRLLLVKKKSVH